MAFEQFLKILVCTAFKYALVINLSLVAFAEFVLDLALEIEVDNGHISAFDVVVYSFFRNAQIGVVHEDHSG